LLKYLKFIPHQQALINLLLMIFHYFNRLKTQQIFQNFFLILNLFKKTKKIDFYFNLHSTCFCSSLEASSHMSNFSSSSFGRVLDFYIFLNFKKCELNLIIFLLFYNKIIIFFFNFFKVCILFVFKFKINNIIEYEFYFL